MSAVDIIVVTYKYDRWLPGCLAGIAEQTLVPRRVLVSDDCSPEPHGQAFRDLAPGFPWAEFVQTPQNMGATLHMRLRISEVRAPYYLLQSADDRLIDPRFLEDAVRILDENPDIVAVFGGHRQVDDEGRVVSSPPQDESASWTRIDARQLRQRLAFDNVVPAVCTVVRNSVHEHIAPFPIENPLGHDWCQWYLMTLYGDFARLNRIVLNYRVHGASISQSAEREDWAANAMDEAYASLIGWPGLDDADRALLERGRRRSSVARTRMVNLWKPLLAAPADPVTWLALGEAVLRRVEARAGRWRQRLKDRIVQEDTR